MRWFKINFIFCMVCSLMNNWLLINYTITMTDTVVDDDDDNDDDDDAFMICCCNNSIDI